MGKECSTGCLGCYWGLFLRKVLLDRLGGRHGLGNKVGESLQDLDRLDLSTTGQSLCSFLCMNLAFALINQTCYISKGKEKKDYLFL